MDWLTFISKIIESSIWPVAAIIIIFIVKDSLPLLFKQIKQLKYKDLLIDFSSEIDSLKAEVKKVPIFSSDFEQKDNERYENLKELSKLSPRAVLLESWIKVEKSFKNLCDRHKDKIPTSGGYRKPMPIKALEVEDVVKSEVVTLFNKLRYVRNQAIHASDFAIQPDKAIEYSKIADILVKNFDNA